MKLNLAQLDRLEAEMNAQHAKERAAIADLRRCVGSLQRFGVMSERLDAGAGELLARAVGKRKAKAGVRERGSEGVRRKAKTPTPPPPHRPTPAAAAAGPGAGSRAAARAVRVAAIRQCGETFTAEEVIERGQLKEEARVLMSTLMVWTRKGWLAVATKGRPGYGTIFRRGLRWRELAGPASPPHSPAPPPPRRGRGSEGVRKRGSEKEETKGERPFRGRPNAQRDAVLALFGVNPGPLSAGEVQDELAKSHPALVDEKLSNLRVRLIDMAQEGLITRLGAGPAARYRANAKPAAAAESEEELNISVPREL